MAEPFFVVLNKEGDFEGVTPMTQTRDDFTVSGQRFYRLNVSGPAGIIDSTIFGLFSDASPKMVGLASSSFNPQTVARILSSDPSDVFREEVDLTPMVQHVVLFPGDRLALLTKEGGRAQVVLSVNELNESDNVQYALAARPFAQVRRLRFIRETGTAFAPNLNGAPWQPTFVFNPQNSLLVTSENTVGPIPASDLCLYPRHQGCYVSVRYSGNGSNAGKLHIVDAETRQSRIVQSNLTAVRWSKVQFVSHDDMIALEASPSVVGSKLVADIEIVRVFPGDRLRGRYEGDV